MGDYLRGEMSSRLLFWRVTRVPIVVVLAWFTVALTLRGKDWILLDGVNLLLHEAGHFFFSWAPRALHVLGGTIGQLIWPVGFACYFWFRRTDVFAATAMVWWFGENLLNIARYLGDAAFEAIPITGEIHDWAFLARRFNFLAFAQEIATGIRVVGILFMVASLAILAKSALFPTEAALEGSLQAEV